MRIEGSVALVTGGASGLGLATVKRLVRAGARVVMVDLARTDGAAVAEHVGGGDAVRFVPADVCDSDAVQRAVEVAGDLGDLRIVVNCAGIGDPWRLLGRSGPVPLERFTRTVEVNLFGTFNVIRLAAVALATVEPVDGERGVIVNTASVAAFDGQIGQAAYSASKGAITAMTLPLARDLARHLVRVMTIAPGTFRTPILDGLPAATLASLAEQVPHPSRLGTPEEFADLVAHVVANGMLNGEVIRLDGALRMAPS